MNGVPLGATMAVARSRLGDPEGKDTTDARETLGHTFYKWRYPDFIVEFADSNLAYITCLTATCRVAGRVVLGASRSAVEARLGRPLPRAAQSSLAAGQVMYVGLKSDCGLTVDYSNNRVTGIKLWCDYS